MRRRLNCYASGDGALHFVWLTGNVAKGGPKITRSVAQRYLDRPKQKHLRDEGWQVVYNGSNWLLVKIYQRVTSTLFRTTGKNEYTEYVVEIDEMKRWKDGTISQRAITVRTSFEEVGIIEVRNVSTLASLVYFINNEAAICKYLRELSKVQKES